MGNLLPKSTHSTPRDTLFNTTESRSHSPGVIQLLQIASLNLYYKQVIFTYAVYKTKTLR